MQYEKITKNQIVATWLGPIALVLFGIGLMNIAQFIPPISPSLNAAQVAEIYRNNSVYIRVGLILVMFSGALLAPITAVFSVLIKRIEGRASVLTYTQIIVGTMALFLFIPPVICWSVAAFRPDRSIETIQMLNDMGWLFFLMTAPPGIIQVFTIGIAILQDKRAQPLLPRWVGYFNLWAGVLFIPGGVVSLFKTGPFAWNGLFAFWIPIPIFGAWWLVMFFSSLKAIRRIDE